MQVREDAYNGHPRFTGVNEKNHTILEQFGATGGFYAYEPTRAFGDGSVVPVEVSRSVSAGVSGLSAGKMVSVGAIFEL